MKAGLIPLVALLGGTLLAGCASSPPPPTTWPGAYAIDSYANGYGLLGDDDKRTQTLTYFVGLEHNPGPTAIISEYKPRPDATYAAVLGKPTGSEAMMSWAMQWDTEANATAFIEGQREGICGGGPGERGERVVLQDGNVLVTLSATNFQGDLSSAMRRDFLDAAAWMRSNTAAVQVC